MIDFESWMILPKTIEKSKRYYAHFDYRTDISKCKGYILKPQNIATHSFYPFVHYVKDMSKYSKGRPGLKEKQRDICYAAHIDRCIVTAQREQENRAKRIMKERCRIRG